MKIGSAVPGEIERIFGRAFLLSGRDRPAGSSPRQTSQNTPNKRHGLIKRALILASLSAFIFVGGVAAHFAYTHFHSQSNSYPVSSRLLNQDYSLSDYHFDLSEAVGKILYPNKGEALSRTFKITGYTYNIPEDRYIVMAVDHEDLRLCWPKRPILFPNCSFSTEIYEGGPVGEFQLSLYAVDQEYYDEIRSWLAAERMGGIPIIPKRYLLDSVKLRVVGV